MLLNLPTSFVWPENKGSRLIFLMLLQHPCFSGEFSRELPPLTTDGLRATETKLHACLTMVPFIAEKNIFPALPALKKQAERIVITLWRHSQQFGMWLYLLELKKQPRDCEMLGVCEDLCVTKTI